VRAVNDEAAGADCFEPGEALRHPVAVGDRLDPERISCRLAHRQLDQLA
jgi:hypothetical protein